MTRVDRIVARLREGPATTLDLIRDCRVANVTSAIRDARNAGHRIDCRRLGRRSVWEYSLVPTKFRFADEAAPWPPKPRPRTVAEWAVAIKDDPKWDDNAYWERRPGGVLPRLDDAGREIVDHVYGPTLKPMIPPEPMPELMSVLEIGGYLGGGDDAIRAALGRMSDTNPDGTAKWWAPDVRKR